MYSHLDRDTLISRLLNDLGEAKSGKPDPILHAFARAVLRRVDDGYLFRHRLTTLGAQLRDSFSWAKEALQSKSVQVRVFHPNEENNGYAIEGQIIETVMPDQPFIFDTLKLYMEQAGVRVMNTLHIILPASLNEDGAVTNIGTADDAKNFSYTRWYVDIDQDREQVCTEVAERLGFARKMVRDFHLIKRDIRAVANEFEYLATLEPGRREEDCNEVAALLNWLVEEHFVFMGLSVYGRDDGGNYATIVKRGLGIAADNATPSAGETSATLAFLGERDDLSWPIARVRKSAQDSMLHRPGKVDEVIVRTFDSEGRVVGGIAIHGMFTFKGLGEQGSTIPILRRKLDRVLALEETVRSSYEHKALVHAFNALPVEYLFEADDETIRGLLRMAVTADDSQEIRSHIATQTDTKSAYAFIVLPKEHYSDDLRALLQTVLQVELDASYADHRLHLGKYGSVALHFYLTGDDNFGSDDLGAIESKLVEIGTPWSVRLRRSLGEEHGAAKGATLFGRYAQAFPEGYTETTSVHEAVVDISHLEQTTGRDAIRFDVFASRTNDDDALLRIYSRNDLLLTDILPVLDNFGVVVVEQNSHEIIALRGPRLLINVLRVRRGDPDLLTQRGELIDALHAVFGRQMRSDRINRLLLSARINWREVDAFRAYFNYSRQLGSQLTSEIIQKLLITHAEFVHRLTELFRVRFDPGLGTPASRRLKLERLEQRLGAYLDGVQGFEEDRVLRMFLNLVQSTVRTNFFQKSDSVHMLSFKIDCSKVADMPSPRPMFEIYVHHSEVEGVHLRGGKVARGGLRWSDRLDDYRSEVLDLMATQMLKNTVIVPVGAKGGFVLKNPPEDYKTARSEADRLYEVFISGLLAVTDNLVDGKIVPPVDVVRYDDDDPYLVVAADKGTAHLSDTANKLSLAANFWLGDAFASGGSVGYDHKEKGITAKGAWVCVRRLFNEMGIDPESDIITATGIGDMSGDVFGNGLLMSKTIKLIAAFNHRHIFIDPDPDPAKSYAERDRLFALGRSAWTDYDTALISRGGGIYDRGAKSILLSPEAKKALGTEETELSGEALIQLILMANVDLLWNGGIGTYIKSSNETHADVGDSDNDRVRVDANTLRCRVIGEGGNLGVTMKGRVEFAHRGGRLNLDAIDNSGGVDLSDHEVNLKTLLSVLVASGKLDKAARDSLLLAVGDEVCVDVLANNSSQSLAISLDERRSRRNLWQLVHAMMHLRSEIGFSRRVACLPRGSELMKQRESSATGFLRPELSKLLSYSKMVAHTGLSERPLGDRDDLRPFLEQYFPTSVVEAHGDAIDAHFLYNEIAATVQVNRVIDAAGVTFIPALTNATERSTSDILAAYLVAEDLLDIAELRASVVAKTKLPIEAKYAALLRIEDALAYATRTLLWNHPEPVTLASTRTLSGVRKAAETIRKKLPEMMIESARRRYDADTAQLEAAGLPKRVSRDLAGLPWIHHAIAVERLSSTTDTSPLGAAHLYFTIGFGTRIFDLIEAVERQHYADRWDNIAVPAICRALSHSIARLAALRRASMLGNKGTGRFRNALAGVEDISAQVGDLLRERIPVSAMLVLSERLKRRIDSMDDGDATTTTTEPAKTDKAV